MVFFSLSTEADKMRDSVGGVVGILHDEHRSHVVFALNCKLFFQFNS